MFVKNNVLRVNHEKMQRQSATTKSPTTPRPLKHWMSQKFCDHSATGCRRNSINTYQVMNTAI